MALSDKETPAYWQMTFEYNRHAIWANDYNKLNWQIINDGA
jgi:hypothetical protein